MVRGAEDGAKVRVIDYDEEQLETLLKGYFKSTD